MSNKVPNIEIIRSNLATEVAQLDVDGMTPLNNHRVSLAHLGSSYLPIPRPFYPEDCDEYYNRYIAGFLVPDVIKLRALALRQETDTLTQGQQIVSHTLARLGHG